MQLTIITPVFNCAPYLRKGFEHLLPLYSSNIEFEVIYVNDGSTDNSLVILEELSNKNKNIKIITQENQGSSGARNTAIEIAKGDFIQFLDADDYLDINKLMSLLVEAKQTNLDVLGYRLDYINEFDEQIGIRPIQTVSQNKVISGEDALIQGYQPSSICVFLFRTEFLNKNNLRITPKITHMDVEFTLRVMLKANKVFFVDEIIYHYLQREGSITNPVSIEKLEQLLFDEVKIAKMMRDNIDSAMPKQVVNVVQKNYNSVVWNLLWRFVVKRKEVSLAFKLKCIDQLTADKLYPIQGELKTRFQKLTRTPFNIKFIFEFLIRRFK